MAKEYSRTLRVGDQMQRELAQLIPREVRDQRLGLVTVTAVEVTKDLGHAKVFVTIMGKESEEDITVSLGILTQVSGYLRTLLGKAMKLRSVPQLHFFYDKSVSRGSELSALIDNAIAQDIKQKQKDNE